MLTGALDEPGCSNLFLLLLNNDEVAAKPIKKELVTFKR